MTAASFDRDTIRDYRLRTRAAQGLPDESPDHVLDAAGRILATVITSADQPNNASAA